MILNWIRNRFKKSEDRPAFLRAYLNGFKDTYSRRTPLEAVRFVVFDTETTGLNIRKDRILSIGAVRIHNWEMDLKDSLECYVRQDYDPLEETIAVHGILPTARESDLEEEQAIQHFLEYCGDSVLVGHHLAFDVAMVNKVLLKMTGQRLKNKQLDTLAMAKRAAHTTEFHREGAFGLDKLCQQFHIPMSDRHTAAGDAYITGILFMKLLARLQKRGVTTLGGLLRKNHFS